MNDQNENVLLTGDDASAFAHLYSWIFRQEDKSQFFVLNFNNVLWSASLKPTAKQTSAWRISRYCYAWLFGSLHPHCNKS